MVYDYFLLFDYRISIILITKYFFNKKYLKMTLLKVSLIKFIKDDTCIIVNVDNFLKLISI